MAVTWTTPTITRLKPDSPYIRVSSTRTDGEQVITVSLETKLPDKDSEAKFCDAMIAGLKANAEKELAVLSDKADLTSSLAATILTGLNLAEAK